MIQHLCRKLFSPFSIRGSIAPSRSPFAYTSVSKKNGKDALAQWRLRLVAFSNQSVMPNSSSISCRLRNPPFSRITVSLCSLPDTNKR